MPWQEELAAAAGIAGACFSERSAVGSAPDTECRLPVGQGVPGSTLVIIRGFAFEPAEVRVKVGGTVTWLNCEPAGTPAHTSTADGGAWSSPTLLSDEAYSFTFTQDGRFGYHCEPHPFMTAAVAVE